MASKVTSSNISVSSTKITDLYPQIMFTHILTRIDHLSLASLALTSTQFHALCKHESIWTKICNSKWQSTKHLLVQNAISSFPGGHRSFFSDSYPILQFGNKYKFSCCYRFDTAPVQRPEHLISAVDIQYDDKIIYSNVDVIKTSTETFASSSFKVEVLDPRESAVRLPIKFGDEEEDIHLSNLKENMTLSWIMIDPTQKRAANVSSQLPVSVRRHWIDGDIEVKYAIVMPRDRCIFEMVEIRIIVMLEWEEERKYLKLRKVSLQVHDMDGICLQGRESLRLLRKAIQFGTRKKAKRDEVIDRYKIFVNKKRERREGRQKRQHKLTIPLLATILVALIIPMFLKVSTLW